MAGTGGGAGADAVDSQLLPQFPDEIQALGRVNLADRAFCHQLTPLLVCPLSSRLSASRGGPLVGSIRAAPARAAAAAIPRLGRTGGTGRPGRYARGAHPGLRLHQRGGNVARVAFGEQVSLVQLGQGGWALAWERASGGRVLGRDEGQRAAFDAHAGGAADAMREPLRRVGEIVVDHQVDVADVEATGGHVGGDQHVGAESTEGVHGAVPNVLREIALQIGAVVTEIAQVAAQLANAMLSAADDGGGAAVPPQWVAERAQLFPTRGTQQPLR